MHNVDASVQLKAEPTDAKSEKLARKAAQKSARKSAQRSAKKSDTNNRNWETSKPLSMFSQDLSNRESSFLAFNERVLELADDLSIPLLERLRYLCISSSNLDEFFEVRVAGIKQKVMGGVEAAGIDGFSPQQELNLINKLAHEFVAKQYKLLNDVLLPSLASEDIKFLVRGNWDDKVMAWIKEYYNDEIAPVLSPLGLDPSHPFPRLMNKSLNFIVDLQGVDAFGRESGFALVRAPRSLPRVIPVPENICGSAHGFVFLSSIIHSQMSSLFSGMQAAGVYQFKVTRNSELYVSDEEVANLRRALQSELLQRNFGQAVRLEVAANCPTRIIRYLQRQFSLADADVYHVNGPVNLNRLVAIPDQIDRPDLKFPAFTPSVAPAFRVDTNIFEHISMHSPVLLHHPYESYGPILEFVRQAANDPDVLAIKQTLYRTGNDSAFVHYLMDASRAGKDVTVVIELRARFDEQANINLATRLQEAGIQVVYGVVGFKTHAKMLLVVRREKTKLVKYAHVGTGNYHATTARLYTDISMLTCQKRITNDVHKIFTQLTGLGQTLNLKNVVQAPFSLHRFIIEKIEEQIVVAETGGNARILARMNSLVDATVIDALYRASRAGVKIKLLIRGICVLKAQVPGLSDNIKVVSVLGRFLEHSRVFCFGTGENMQLYISSADWMPRNFYNRVEIAVPVEGGALQRIKHECLDIYFKDNQYCWQLQSDGQYKRCEADGAEPFSAQQYLIDRHDAGLTHG